MTVDRLAAFFKTKKRLFLPHWDRSMLPPKAFYFFFYAAAASLIPFLALFYAEMGLSGTQIGLLSGILPLITMISAPLWGALADTARQHRRLLGFAISGALISVLVLSATTTFRWMIATLIVYAFFAAPIMPLVDNAVVQMLGDRKEQYGRQRLWGAVGWGVAAPVTGALIDRSGLQWAFAGYAVLMFGGLLVSRRLPITHTKIGGDYVRGLRLLMMNGRWIIFLLAILIGFLSLSMVTSFLFLYLADLGASKMLMGFSLTVATLSEIPIWFFSDRLLDRWGTRGVLTMSLLACGAQAFALSFIRTPWLVLPIQLLHGPSFSAMWAAGVTYASQNAPSGMGATAQGVFTGVAMGLRSALGAFIGGYLYDSVGVVMMFRVGGLCALVGLAVFVVGNLGWDCFLRRNPVYPVQVDE